MTDKNSPQTFWDHLDELRGTLIKISLVTVICAIVAFICKDIVFEIVFAPKKDSFVTYRLLQSIGGIFSSNTMDDFAVPVINTGLAQQFMIHMKTAFCVGIVCASPYIIYQLFLFISPALYDHERKYAWKLVGSGYIMFIIGLLSGYFLIFPLTFRFLGTYQVAPDIVNMISLDSYMSTLILLCMAMGVVFELPVICWLFAKTGILNSGIMKKFRKHSIVTILILAAIITPTSDVFTLVAVSLPIWLLYEGSILLVRTVEEKSIRTYPEMSLQ